MNTSFGIEWDTNILVFFPEGRLPQDIEPKKNFLEDRNKIEMTLENWTSYPDNIPEKYMSSDEEYLYSLEVQIGPFFGRENKFNISEFTEVLNEFKKKWEEITETKKISIKETPYDIMIFRTKSENTEEYFCTDPAIIKHCTEISEEEGFTQTFKQRIFGMPQITIGIGFKEVYKLFLTFYRLYNNYKDFFDTKEAQFYLFKNMFLSIKKLATFTQEIKNKIILSIEARIFFLLYIYFIISYESYEKFNVAIFKFACLFLQRTDFHDLFFKLLENGKITEEIFNDCLNTESLKSLETGYTSDIIKELNTYIIKGEEKENLIFIGWSYPYNGDENIILEFRGILYLLTFFEWEKDTNSDFKKLKLSKHRQFGLPFLEYHINRIVDFLEKSISSN